MRGWGCGLCKGECEGQNDGSGLAAVRSLCAHDSVFTIPYGCVYRVNGPVAA